MIRWFFLSLTLSITLTSGAYARLAWSHQPNTTATFLNIERVGDVIYFFRDTPAQVERYDIVNKSWLAPITFDVVPTVATVDADGYYIASDRTVFRYKLDGTGKRHIYNAATTVYDLLSSTDYFFVVFTGSYYLEAAFASFNKSDNSYINYFENRYHVRGASISESNMAIIGRSSGISPSDIQKFSYDASGNVYQSIDSPYHGDYPGANQTWVFPDDQRVIDNKGIIYSANDLTYLGGLGGDIDQIAFNAGAPVILRGTELIAHNAGLLPTGSYTLNATPTHIETQGDQLFVFFPDSASSSGLVAIPGPLSDIGAPQPGTPIDPACLAFMPDEVFVRDDGNLILVSKTHLSVFIWDVDAQAYIDSISLTGAPTHVAYASEDNRIYTSYSGGLIKMMDLDDPTRQEEPFYLLPQSARGLAGLGSMLFAIDSSGAWNTHYTIANDGTLLDSIDWAYYSEEYVWSDELDRLYFFRDDTSPNDILYEEINPVTGEIGNEVDSPEHTSSGKQHPIRLAPDSSMIILGSGRLYNPVNLDQSGSLANTITDVAWSGNTPVSVRPAGQDTQIQTWLSPTWAIGTSKLLPGSPQRIFALSDHSVVTLTTLEDGSTALNRLDASLSLMEPSDLLAPASVSVSKTDVRDVLIEWCDVNEHAYSVERRVDGGAWQTVASLSFNVVSHEETNLPNGDYDYRVVSSAGSQSETSAVVSVTIATPPVTPTGFGIRADATPRVILKWDALDSVDTVTIERKLSTASDWSVIKQLAGTATSYTDTLVASGVNYQYRIKGENVAGASPYSSIETVEVPFDSVPGAVILQLDGSGLLSWNSLPKATRYEVLTRTSDASAWIVAATLGSQQTSFDLSLATGLAPSTTYDVAVRGTNSLGVGGTSNRIAYTTPELLLVDSFDPLNSALWATISGGESKLVSDGYVGNCLYFAESGPRFATTTVLDGTSITTVQCKARLGDGRAPWEKADSGESVVLEGSTNGGTSWDQIAYVLDESRNPVGWQDFSVPLPEPFRVPGLTLRWRQLADSGSTFDVWAIDDVAITQVVPTTPPPVPFFFVAVSSGMTEISLLWIDIDGESTYQIQRAPSVAGPWVDLTDLPSNSSLYADRGLLPVTWHYYRIRAFNAAGASVWSPITFDRTWNFREQWRYENWGSTEQTPQSADFANPADDGINNLTKYAYNLDPTRPDNRIINPGSGQSGLPYMDLAEIVTLDDAFDEPEDKDSSSKLGVDDEIQVLNQPSPTEAQALSVEYVRRKAAVDDSVVYIVEFSDSPAFDSNLSNGEEILVESIDELWERVICVDTEDTSTASKRFVRVRVENN